MQSWHEKLFISVIVYPYCYFVSHMGNNALCPFWRKFVILSQECDPETSNISKLPDHNPIENLWSLLEELRKEKNPINLNTKTMLEKYIQKCKRYVQI